MIAPWIGEAWGDPGNFLNGVRLLIVGESPHATEYEVGSKPPNLTVETVRQFLERGEKWRFYRVLTALLANKPAGDLTDDLTRDIWSSVAFLNYVPMVAASYSRTRPTPEMFKSGAEPFGKFLRSYSPAAAMICGGDTWHWALIGLGFEGTPWKETRYQAEGVPMRPISHPSTGFSYAKNRPVLEALLSEASNKL